MLKRKSFRRAKVNCLCRCTPKQGIISLNPDYVNSICDRAYDVLCHSRSTGAIAAAAVRTGEMLEHTGHYPRALELYATAINTIYSIDSNRAEDYYNFGPLPSNPHFRYWYERMNDADALEVAVRLDALYLRMGFRGEAHQCRRIRLDYEILFRGVYSACM